MTRRVGIGQVGIGQVGIGMIGAGMVGQLAHLANFAALSGARVVALAELRPELGEQAAAQYGVPVVYASHREMLNDPDVEAVVVVTRRPATGPIVLDALRAGRHVLSEKPMAHTVEQAERLVAAAREADVRYSVGFMKRHDPGVALARDLMVGGGLGRLVSVEAWCLGGDFNRDVTEHVMTREARPEGLVLWPVAPDWLPAELHAAYSGFVNVFVHNINLLRFLLGDGIGVRDVDLAGQGARRIGFDCGGVAVNLEMAESPSGDWREGVEARFEGGSVRLDMCAPLDRRPARVTLTRSGSPPSEFAPPHDWAFRRQAEAFVAEIADGAPAVASGADSVEDMRLIEGIWRRHLGEAA